MIFERKATALLKQWKESCNGTYAALLEGPRRVGKSTIAEQFAKSNYKSYIKIDFSNITPRALSVFDSIADLDEFFLRLQAVTGVVLHRRKSAIIFDEIQLQPKVRQAIKYLVADGRYDYIETGSLLSIKKNVRNIVIPSEERKIPVYPMDYEEFLLANGKTSFDVLREIFERKKPIGQDVNRKLLRDFRTYLAVGGMPQAVEAFVQKKSFKEIDSVKRGIIDLYKDDFFKIDPSGRISMLFDSIPSQLARTTKQFSLHFALKKKLSSKDEELLSDLINSRTVLRCHNCADPTISLSQGKRLDEFKLYMADSGLFVTQLLKTGVITDNLLYDKLLSDKLPANLGFLYENIVAQTLAARGEDLYYMSWPKPNSTHSYELDFLIGKGPKISPVEVKSSRTDQHHSLDEFIRKYSSIAKDPCILSQKDIGKDKAINLYPFYLTAFI